MDRTRHTDELGFTLIEVMVAACILVSGILVVLTFIIEAQATTFTNQARANANALVREAVEGAKSVPNDQLVNATLVDTMRQRVGMSDDELGVPGWQLQRGGIVYTVSVGVCAVDDPRDGIGTHEAGIFCASGTTGTAVEACSQLLSIVGDVGLPGAGVSGAAAAGLGDCGLDVDFDGQVDGLVDVAGSVCVGACALGGVDTSPADAKRVVVLVRWDRGGGSRYVLQGTTVANPGLAGAPAIATLTSSVASPVTGPGVTEIQVGATTSVGAATVGAYVDGTQRGTATGSGTSWSFRWPLGTVSGGSAPGADEVLDGSYLVGMKAFDVNGQFGQSRSLTVLLNRRAPYPPGGLQAGRNGAAADLEWQPSAERDVELYRGFRSTGSGWTQICESTTPSCTDPSPPGIGILTYTVAAVDRDAAGNLREGAKATSASAPLLNAAPYAPSGLTLSKASGAPVLSWSASAGDPDIGDGVDHYRVYRDGTALSSRYDRTGNSTAVTWTDTQTGGQAHSYWIVAVDSHLAESTLVGPVSG
ncbi:hypothetical protein [Paraconexibacter sp. AEG42_29]